MQIHQTHADGFGHQYQVQPKNNFVPPVGNPYDLYQGKKPQQQSNGGGVGSNPYDLYQDNKQQNFMGGGSAASSQFSVNERSNVSNAI